MISATFTASSRGVQGSPAGPMTELPLRCWRLLPPLSQGKVFTSSDCLTLLALWLAICDVSAFPTRIPFSVRSLRSSFLRKLSLPTERDRFPFPLPLSLDSTSSIRSGDNRGSADGSDESNSRSDDDGNDPLTPPLIRFATGRSELTVRSIGELFLFLAKKDEMVCWPWKELVVLGLMAMDHKCRVWLNSGSKRDSAYAYATVTVRIGQI